MSDRFFTADPLGPGEYALTGSEAHHLATVRRFAPGDRIVLFNGDGHEYPAEIISVGKRTVALTVLAPVAVDRELPFPLVVGSALPKGDRADFLIEKLTELGVTRFVPLTTARAVVQPKASVVEKFERAVIEASKQCGRNRLMLVDGPQKWDEFAARTDLPPLRLVLHTGSGLSKAGASGGCAVAVGPEGGFAPEEIALALETGWTAGEPRIAGAAWKRRRSLPRRFLASKGVSCCRHEPPPARLIVLLLQFQQCIFEGGRGGVALARFLRDGFHQEFGQIVVDLRVQFLRRCAGACSTGGGTSPRSRPTGPRAVDR